MLLNLRVDDAISLFQEVASIEPEGPYSALSTGLIFFAQDDLENALYTLKTVKNRWPLLTDTLFYLGMTYRKLGTKTDENKLFLFQSSLDCFDEYIDSGMDSSARPYVEKALTYLKISGHYKRGENKEKLKVLNQAEKCVDKVLKVIDSTNSYALVTKANILYSKSFCLHDPEKSKELIKEAVNLVERVLASEKADASTECFALGFNVKVALEEKEYETVEAVCEKAKKLQYFQKDPYFLRTLQMAQRKLGKTPEAKETCELWRTLYPSDPWAYANLGVVLKKANPTEALVQFNKAIDLGVACEDVKNFVTPYIAHILKKNGEFLSALWVIAKAPEKTIANKKTRRLVQELLVHLYAKVIELEKEAINEAVNRNKKIELLGEALEIKEHISEWETREYLENNNDISDSKEYKCNKIWLFKRLSKRYRLEGNFESALALTKECWELADELYTKFKKEGYKRSVFASEHMYWNLKAHQFEMNGKPRDVAEYYRKSAEAASKFNEDTGLDEYANYYRYLALVNLNDRKKFETNIDGAISFSEKRGDEDRK